MSSNTEMGEYLVGAYLKLIERCDVVDYNVRPPGGGIAGLNELDVVGFRFSDGTIFLCEVTTHIRGSLYGSGNPDTVARIRTKHQRQKEHAQSHFQSFLNKRYQFWAPVVPKGAITSALSQISDLELIINGEYKRRINALQTKARTDRQDTGNPAFRVLQILEALRE